MTQSELKPEHLPAASASKPIVFSILILISGIVIGAGVMLIISEKLEAKQEPPNDANQLEIFPVIDNPLPSEVIDTWVGGFTQIYKLSPEQKEQIKPVFRAWATEMEILRLKDIEYYTGRGNKITEITQDMHEGVVEILNKQQTELWNSQFTPEWERVFNPWHTYRNQGFQWPVFGIDANSQQRRNNGRRGERFPGEPPHGQFPSGNGMMPPPQQNPPPENNNN